MAFYNAMRPYPPPPRTNFFDDDEVTIVPHPPVRDVLNHAFRHYKIMYGPAAGLGILAAKTAHSWAKSAYSDALSGPYGQLLSAARMDPSAALAAAGDVARAYVKHSVTGSSPTIDDFPNVVEFSRTFSRRAKRELSPRAYLPPIIRPHQPYVSDVSNPFAPVSRPATSASVVVTPPTLVAPSAPAVSSVPTLHIPGVFYRRSFSSSRSSSFFRKRRRRFRRYYRFPRFRRTLPVARISSSSRIRYRSLRNRRLAFTTGHRYVFPRFRRYA